MSSKKAAIKHTRLFTQPDSNGKIQRLHCLHCGETEVILMPMEISPFCRKINLFNRRHRKCEKKHVCGAQCPGFPQQP